MRPFAWSHARQWYGGNISLTHFAWGQGSQTERALFDPDCCVKITFCRTITEPGHRWGGEGCKHRRWSPLVIMAVARHLPSWSFLGELEGFLKHMGDLICPLQISMFLIPQGENLMLMQMDQCISLHLIKFLRLVPCGRVCGWGALHGLEAPMQILQLLEPRGLGHPTGLVKIGMRYIIFFGLHDTHKRAHTWIFSTFKYPGCIYNRDNDMAGCRNSCIIWKMMMISRLCLKLLGRDHDLLCVILDIRVTLI